MIQLFLISSLVAVWFIADAGGATACARMDELDMQFKEIEQEFKTISVEANFHRGIATKLGQELNALKDFRSVVYRMNWIVYDGAPRMPDASEAPMLIDQLAEASAVRPDEGLGGLRSVGTRLVGQFGGPFVARSLEALIKANEIQFGGHQIEAQELGERKVYKEGLTLVTECTRAIEECSDELDDEAEAVQSQILLANGEIETVQIRLNLVSSILSMHAQPLLERDMGGCYWPQPMGQFSHMFQYLLSLDFEEPELSNTINFNIWSGLMGYPSQGQSWSCVLDAMWNDLVTAEQELVGTIFNTKLSTLHEQLEKISARRESLIRLLEKLYVDI